MVEAVGDHWAIALAVVVLLLGLAIWLRARRD
jgi:hypothetical protein